MRLPLQSPPVSRSARGPINAQASGPHASGMQPSACGPTNTGQGQCFDTNGPIGGPTAHNCSACCARRGAIHWQGVNGTFAICH